MVPSFFCPERHLAAMEAPPKNPVGRREERRGSPMHGDGCPGGGRTLRKELDGNIDMFY